MEDAILYGLEKLNFTELRPNQRNDIEEYASRKYVGFFLLSNWQWEITYFWNCSFCVELFERQNPIA